MRGVGRSLVVGLVVVLSTVGRAAPARDDLVVSAQWLAQHAGDADLVLLHVGEKPAYDVEHLAGARFVTTRDLARAGGDETSLTLEMPDAETLRTRLEALGISDRSHVVVYYSKDWLSPATRVVFTLLYAGIDRVSMLDGGLEAWKAAGRSVTAALPAAAPGHLSALKVRPLVVDAEFVRAHSNTPGYAVVDARASAFYDGSQQGGPRDRRKAGHIPGARSVPFSDMVSADMRLKSPEALAALFRGAGVRDGDTVVAYCHIGQQATATLFGAMTLGHPVLLYDGSFEDWARRDLPVENPDALAGLQFLVGDWVAVDTPAGESGSFAFKPAVQGRVIVRTNEANYAATADRPASRHDDLLVIYSENGAVKADYFDSEGHVIRYAVTADANGATFVSAPDTREPRYRLSYRRDSSDALLGTFEVAAPGSPDAFKPYLTWKAKRK